ncbi:MAG: cation diffusion facilitator family transporter [Chlamydiales bacterium]
MSKFPEPVSLPADVYALRDKRHAQLVQSAKWGIKVRLSIILFELIGYLFINSSSLFMDIVASLLDILTTLFLIFCIQLAKKPPDRDHPFGHGRYEPLGGLLLGLSLAAMGAMLFVQQLLGAIQEEHVREIGVWGWMFPGVAVVLLEICYRYMIKTARQENSPALAADAYHYRMDGITSLFATIALLTAAFLPHWSLLIDHIGAILIDLFMIVTGFIAVRENFHQLMDKVPSESFFMQVKAAASKVAGVLGTEKILIQLYGPDAHVDIDIEVDPQLSVDLAHQISQCVRVEIQKAWPAVRDVTVHIEPYYANDH